MAEKMCVQCNFEGNSLQPQLKGGSLAIWPNWNNLTQEITSNSDIEGSWIGSSFTLGAVLSAPIGGRLMNMIGMRRTMVWMAAPFTLGWILILLPYPLAIEGSAALWMFYSGRFLTGGQTENIYPHKILPQWNIFLGVGGGVYTLLAPLYRELHSSVTELKIIHRASSYKLNYNHQGCDVSSRVSPRTKRYDPFCIFICIVFVFDMIQDQGGPAGFSL